jgi:hypothetical protein
MGRPERHARPSWLAPSQRQGAGGGDPQPNPDGGNDGPILEIAVGAADGALRQLNNLAQQKQQAAEIQDFLRDKFTNHALYLFLQQETAALHRQMFDVAWCWARQAQRAFQLERERGVHPCAEVADESRHVPVLARPATRPHATRRAVVRGADARWRAQPRDRVRAGPRLRMR